MNIRSIHEGDVFATLENGEWHVKRVLRMENGSATLHLMLYPPYPSRPSIGQVQRTEPFVLHVPVMYADGDYQGEYLGNIPVEERDMTGYNAYVEEMSAGNDDTEHEHMHVFTEETIKRISEAFDRANRHYDKRRYDEAILAYTEVLELWPDYYEALDNMGYVYMDIGQHDKAIELFHRSLEINPFGVTAHGSLGDCHLHCGRFEEARSHYRDAITFAPGHRRLYRLLNTVEKKLGMPITKRPKAKSWWRFW